MPGETVDSHSAAVGGALHSGSHLLRVYRAWLGPVAPTELFIAAMTDYTYRQPSIAIAERHALHHPTFMYDFRWASPVQDGALGEGHTVDVPFALHTLWTPHTPYHLGDNPPVALADQMHEAWSTFARTGRPAAATLPEWLPEAKHQTAAVTYKKA